MCKCCCQCDTADFLISLFPIWLSVFFRDQKFLFSRGLGYESYQRLTVSMAPSISMNADGYEQIPETKEMLCRNGIAEHDRGTMLTLTPGY